jgi:hypothetical protein
VDRRFLRNEAGAYVHARHAHRKRSYEPRAAAGSSWISFSPGWPPHSKPSTLTAPQLIFSAFDECRTQVHLWIAQRRSRSSIATMLYNAEFRRSL